MDNEKVVTAPVNLDAKTRVTFRDTALAALEELGDQAGGKLIIDLAATRRLDSAALGMLVMLQLRPPNGSWWCRCETSRKKSVSCC